jgi:hypothetical protein
VQPKAGTPNDFKCGIDGAKRSLLENNLQPWLAANEADRN